MGWDDLEGKSRILGRYLEHGRVHGQADAKTGGGQQISLEKARKILFQGV